MTALPSRRPWWKRKRTWAAAVWLALPALYVLGVGPAAAAMKHGRLSPGAYWLVFRHVWAAGDATGSSGAIDRYCDWWTSQTRPCR